MFHKNISFYRDYLKSRTENYTYLLPVDLIPPQRLKDKPLNLVTEFVFSIPLVSIESKKIDNVVYLDLHSLDVFGKTDFIASAYPLKYEPLVDDANLYYFKFDSKCFLYAEYYNDVNVRMFKVDSSLAHWIDSAYNYFLPDTNTSGNINSPKYVPTVNIDFEGPTRSIDSLYNKDLVIDSNDRGGSNV